MPHGAHLECAWLGEIARRHGTLVGMPPAVNCYTGRNAELATLDRHGEEAATNGTHGMTVALIGTAGVGKTALALQCAERLSDEFPGGQLYVNMRGFDGGPATTTAQALSSLLAQSGLPVAAEAAPTTTLLRRYRETLSRRRALIVLDDIRDAHQVRPLLAERTGCLTLLTSRTTLPWLSDRPRARLLHLDLPSLAEARAMLILRIGELRVAAEPAAVDEIIERAGRLPLALAIVAARAAIHPQFSLAEVVADMRSYERPLDAFAAGEPISDVRTVISWSYAALSPAARRAFRTLGQRSSAEVSVDEAAAMLPVDAAAAGRLLDELGQTHLIQPAGPGRYVMHQLNHAFAAELAAAEPARASTRRALSVC